MHVPPQYIVPPCFSKEHSNIIIVPSTPDTCKWLGFFFRVLCMWTLQCVLCVRPSSRRFLHTSSVSLIAAAWYKLWSGSLSGFICPLCYFLPLRLKCFHTASCSTTSWISGLPFGWKTKFYTRAKTEKKKTSLFTPYLVIVRTCIGDGRRNAFL